MNRSAFFKAIRSLFKRGLRQEQVDGINGILRAFVTHGDGREKTLAYALATAYHETGRKMAPVREGFAKTDADARRAVNNLARRRGPNSAVARYAKPAGPHGHVYYGRGHVQLTWLDNYRRSSADAGVDLVADPDAMLDPEVSARVLIKGLIDGRWNGRGKGIAHYLPDHGRDDLKNARRTVNITDKWQLVGGYYSHFLAAIRAAGGVPETPEEPPLTVKEPSTAPEAAKDHSALVAALAALLLAIGGIIGGSASGLIAQIMDMLP